MLGPMEIFLGKDCLYTISKKANIKLSKFQQLLLCHNGPNATRKIYFDIGDITLMYQHRGIGMKLKKRKFALHFLLFIQTCISK